VPKAKSAWFGSRRALFVHAAAGLVLAYAFASRAIDTGSLWHYLGSLVFLVLSIKLVIRAVERARHVKTQAGKTG
jgi:hypothetical protein